MKSAATLLLSGLVLLWEAAWAGTWVAKAIVTTDGTITQKTQPTNPEPCVTQTIEADDFGATPYDEMHAKAFCMVLPYTDENYSDLSAWVRAQNMYIKKGYDWVGCTPPQNGLFDLSVTRVATWLVEGDASNWSPSAGTAEAWSQFDLVINTSPDDKCDYTSAGDYHGKRKEGTSWSGTLHLSWPPGVDLEWDDKAGDDFRDSDSKTSAILQNYSNKGQAHVHTEINLSIYAKAEGLTDAKGATAKMEVDVTNFQLSPQ